MGYNVYLIIHRHQWLLLLSENRAGQSCPDSSVEADAAITPDERHRTDRTMPMMDEMTSTYVSPAPCQSIHIGVVIEDDLRLRNIAPANSHGMPAPAIVPSALILSNDGHRHQHSIP